MLLKAGMEALDSWVYLVEHVLSKRMDITDRIRFLSDDGEEIDPNGNNKIDFVVFDGTNEELFVIFF